MFGLEFVTLRSKEIAVWFWYVKGRIKCERQFGIEEQKQSFNIESYRLTVQLKITVLSVLMLYGFHMLGRFENGGIISQKMVMFLVTTLRTSHVA